MARKIDPVRLEAYITRLRMERSLDLAGIAAYPDINIPFPDVLRELETNPDFKDEIKAHMVALGYETLNNISKHVRGEGFGDAPNSAIAKIFLETTLPDLFGKTKKVEEPPEGEDLSDEERKALGLPVKKK